MPTDPLDCNLSLDLSLSLSEMTGERLLVVIESNDGLFENLFYVDEQVSSIIELELANLVKLVSVLLIFKIL